MIDIKVPTVGESISEVTLLKWNKKDGDYVDRDEVIAELESEKATFEVNAEKAGVLKTSAQEGDTLKIGDVLASIDETAAKPEKQEKKEAAVDSSSNGKPQAEKKKEEKKGHEKKEKGSEEIEGLKHPVIIEPEETSVKEVKASPVASAMIADKKIKTSSISPSGTGGKILKDDVLAALSTPGKITGGKPLFSRDEKKEKMTQLRKTISRRLVEAKNTTAMLTTFNEVDMSRIMEIRNKYKEKFKEIHGVGLGFMSFFAKACCIALQEWPPVNAYIDADQLIYHDYCDISIAVSTPRGLTVPVIRNVESLNMADIEKKVIELATKAKDNKLSMEELQGGTFTITNGGVFGSLMSTPIINLPQSAILGMHKIEERPVAVNGQVVIKPMMYVALSYDHRIIDGRESVSFLVRVKELLENPDQLLFGKDPVKTLLEL
jgi:2-oxoglutarate dehydrogenase E2 component (dihydrolipoamide succinyltransferase)